MMQMLESLDYDTKWVVDWADHVRTCNYQFLISFTCILEISNNCYIYELNVMINIIFHSIILLSTSALYEVFMVTFFDKIFHLLTKILI